MESERQKPTVSNDNEMGINDGNQSKEYYRGAPAFVARFKLLDRNPESCRHTGFQSAPDWFSCIIEDLECHLAGTTRLTQATGQSPGNSTASYCGGEGPSGQAAEQHGQCAVLRAEDHQQMKNLVYLVVQGQDAAPTCFQL